MYPYVAFFSALINSLPGLIGFLSDESDFRTALEVCRVTLLHRWGVRAFQFRLNDDDDDDVVVDDDDDDDDVVVDDDDDVVDDDDGFWIAQTLVKIVGKSSIHFFERDPFLTFIIHSYRS